MWIPYILMLQYFLLKLPVRVEDEVLIVAYNSITEFFTTCASFISGDQDILALCTTNKEFSLI